MQGAATPASREESNKNRSVNSLSRNPRCLYLLWLEYEQGIDGRKAATIFNAYDKCSNQQLYCERNTFLSKVIQMVNNAGWESDKAIDEIRAHYGTNLSVTSTMKNEKR